MNDWNVAEREAQICSANATPEQCYGTGRIHKAYGWARSCDGSWNKQQVELYNKGFDGMPILNSIMIAAQEAYKALGYCAMPFDTWLEKEKLAGRYWGA